MDFKVGDWVSWKTYIGTIPISKKGEIILILNPGENFFEAVEGLKNRYRFSIIHNKEKIRNHLSYVVLIRDGEGMPRLYWPDVSDLHKVCKVTVTLKKKIKGRSKKCLKS